MPPLPDSRRTPRALLALVALALAVGILAGLRWPQVYALTHWLIDYHYGFGKRGLLGTLLRLIDKPPYHYRTLVVMAGSIAIAGLALLLALGWRAARRDAGVAAAYVICFLSAGFASWVRDVGRGEHIGLLLALLCLALPARGLLLAARAALMAVAVLVHEANFLLFMPLVAFDVFLATRARGAPAGLLRAAAVSFPVAVLTFALGNMRTACDLMGASAHYAHMAADFPIWGIAVGTLCLDGAANWRHAHEVFTWLEIEPIQFGMAAAVTLPGVLATFMLISRALTPQTGHSTDAPRAPLLDEALALLTIFAPWSLLLVATDVVRFTTMVQITALAALLAAMRRGAAAPTLRTPGEAALLAAVAAFELGSSVPLGDGREMLKFPFAPLVQHMDDVLHRRAPFIIVPAD